MIGTITLNPCIDRTCKLSHFSYGGMNRMFSDRRDVSGKGINVSLALLQNGVPVRTSGFLYTGGKTMFLEKLKNLGIDYEGIQVDGTIRENIKLWDVESGITTEINQSGSYVPREKWEYFKKQYADFLEGLDMVILSGSVPEGIGKDAYRQLIELANEKSIPSILDAEGQLMKEGLAAHPFLIKPNLFEFKDAFHPEDDTIPGIVSTAKKLISDGLCSYICITLGSNGALMVSRDAAWFCTPMSFDIKCTQGAGDSVVAGIAMAWSEGKGLEDMLRYGIAMANGTLTREGTQMCFREDFLHFLPELKIEVIA